MKKDHIHNELPDEMLDRKQDEALDRLLADAKTEFDEVWMREAEQHMPAGMEQRLRATIDRLAAQEQASAPAEAPDPLSAHQPQATIPPRGGRHIWLYRAAASITLLFTLGISWHVMAHENDPFTDTCKTPEEAHAQLERALNLLSKNGNRAIKEARHSLRDTQEVHERTDISVLSIE